MNEIEDTLIEDFEVALKNRDKGITEYLNSLGKLWVTPFGCYSTLKQVENVTGKERKTLIRRFNSKRTKYNNWYVIDGGSDLYPAENCEYCDELDDSLFYEMCWLCHVQHEHNTPITEETIFKYLFEGKSYETTYGLWVEGYREHLEIGDLTND